MAVKTTKAGSIKALRTSVERKGGGNDQFLQRVPADDSIMVRFLTEPDEWQSYFEHYDQVMRYYPCSDDCPGCTEGNRPSQRYLANVLDIQNDRVVPMVIPKTLVTKLLNSYDRYTTMTDRDYDLIRLGSGLDTDYDRSPEAPAKRSVNKYTLLDLEAVLENQLRRAFDQDTDEEEAPPSSRASSKPGKARIVPIVSDDLDDEDEEATSSVKVDREELEDMSLRELRTFAKADVGIAQADIRGLDQDALVELILARTDQTNYGDDDDADTGDVDSEDAEATSEPGTGEDEEEDSGDDDEELTEEDIRAMTLQELRKLCGQLEIPWKRTDGKNLLIKKILESTAAEEDEDDEPPF